MNKFKLKKSAEADKGNKEDTKKAKAAADKKHSAPPKGTVETGGTAAEAVSAEQAREAERQQMERWESNRVGHAPAPLADTMTGGDADPTPARSGVYFVVCVSWCSVGCATMPLWSLCDDVVALHGD